MREVLWKSLSPWRRTMTFVYDQDGTISYRAGSVVFRQLSGARAPGDAVLLLPAEISLAGVVLIADTENATRDAVQAAQKYRVVEQERRVLDEQQHIVYLRSL
ncbi:hypothetical protein [Thermosporothrix hazakensis]|uniref:hypothetical protein n=1 Tax=Thermosporothrix hazakensis TaxID=644383 RepID=UPI000DAEE59A|nr:hypothetical protein [Thermosporothrix hazakensis]GCE51106.1 hypothetical protein KTH_59750 [Thermosporothrix hazakensis]